MFWVWASAGLLDLNLLGRWQGEGLGQAGWIRKSRASREGEVSPRAVTASRHCCFRQGWGFGFPPRGVQLGNKELTNRSSTCSHTSQLPVPPSQPLPCCDTSSELVPWRCWAIVPDTHCCHFSRWSFSAVLHTPLKWSSQSFQPRRISRFNILCPVKLLLSKTKWWTSYCAASVLATADNRTGRRELDPGFL